MIEMKVAGLTMDPLTNTPIVILKDLDNRRAIPIWIGLYEATAIATELEQVFFSRPMTHDLLRDVLNSLEVQTERIEIVDIRNNTFFANIHLKKGEHRIIVDSRPSDAIALALRVKVPIYVDEKVITKSRQVDFGLKEEEMDELKKEKLKEFLENLSPEDFGKYKM
jgi:bifunctional DNase/RNase